MTKARPIIFDGESVRAIISERKTQTRRVVNLKHVLTPGQRRIGFHQCPDPDQFRHDYVVKGVPRLHVPVRHPEDPDWPWSDFGCNTFHAPWDLGDLLWVRETHRFIWAEGDVGEPSDTRWEYKAGGWHQACVLDAPTLDQQAAEREFAGERYSVRWRSPIHMPRCASRLTLRVTGVRVERLQEISNDDAWCEGVSNSPEYDCVAYFRERWNQINGKRAPWESSPWVWVVEFNRVED